MADIRFDYQQIEDLIAAFRAVHEYSTGQGFLAPFPESDDAIVEDHAGTVHDEEDSVITEMFNSFNGAREGAQDAYNVFKVADRVEG